MPQIFVLSVALIFCFACGQKISAQSEIDVEEFEKTLKYDYKHAAVVAYVDVKERTLVDSIGSDDCENDKGNGYCLYRLKGELKELYRGKIRAREIEFYESPDADYPKKYLLGEKIIFLNWGKKKPEKKKELFALENSTRSIEHDALRRMRKIAGRKG